MARIYGVGAHLPNTVPASQALQWYYCGSECESGEQSGIWVIHAMAGQCMKIVFGVWCCSVLLVLGAGRAQADTSCLGGISSGATCVQHTGSYGGVGSAGSRSDQQGRQHSGFGAKKAKGLASIHRRNKGSDSKEIKPVSQNSLGENVDYFGDEADHDAKGGLITCLKDSYGHRVCM